MNPAYPIAPVREYALAGAKVPQSLLEGRFPADREGLARIDLLVEDGRIAALAPAGSIPAGDRPRLELGGSIALPLFVDAHTHLDKGHIWPRAPNPDGSFATALQTVKADRAANWTAEDVSQRMEFALRCAFAHGSTAIRTHLDSIGAQTRISWPVFAATRDRWRGRIALQASPLFLAEYAFDETHMRDVEEMVDAHGSGILGAVTYAMPRLGEALEILFRLAEKKAWELDFHVDETLDPEARSLRTITEMALDRRFAGNILVGHCCSLAVHGDDDAKRTIDLVAKAGIAVVSLPMCNLYLQDRAAGRTPRRRGVTALHELKAAGVRVAVASDNTRDAFHPNGDLDMIEVWREGARILHLDHPVERWAPAFFSEPAAILGLKGVGALGVGRSADMILTTARSFTEFFARPQVDRTIVRAGVAMADVPPSYSELDDLKGLRP
ncbi:MAG TPA: cytosine deaminase [Roseiarcus sp.]|nr:cytosine deaminase [Roseiarcus sp.]